MTSFKDKLVDDKLFCKKMKQIANMKSKDEAWIDELESLHTRRGIRALKSQSLLQSSIKITIDSNIDNQAVRSRCAEIKISALRQQIIIEQIVKLLKKYLSANYAVFLSKKYRNAPERKAAIEYVLDPAIKMDDRLQLVMKIADIVIDDCDSAGYTMHRIGTALELKSKDRF